MENLGMIVSEAENDLGSNSSDAAEQQKGSLHSHGGSGGCSSWVSELTETKEDGEGKEKEEEDVKKEDPFFKTSLCSYFRKAGACRHGENCRYAHAESELRPRLDGSWDPTSSLARAEAALSSPPPSAAMAGGEQKSEDIANPLQKCILDLPLKWTSEDLHKLLSEKGISFRSSRKRSRSTVGFVEFESDEHVGHAKKTLDGLSVHSKMLKMEDALPRVWERENAHDSSVIVDNEGNAKLSDICDAVTPLAKLPYEQQLEQKSSEICQLLKKLVRNVRKAMSPGSSLPQWVIDAKFQGGMCCPFDGIIPSPVVDGYRNKCEFTIGHSSDGRRMVGFLLGNFREGCNIVKEPKQCRNVSAIALAYVEAFQKFIEGSELSVWDKKTNSGFWRLFTVREGRTESATSSISEVMLIVQVCSSGVDESVRAQAYDRLARDLALAASQACPQLPLSALIIQDHLGISNAASPDSPLISLSIPCVENGIERMEKRKTINYIHDHICNLQFRISPTAFFQVNTLAAEKLYNQAGDWAGLDGKTLLFDVCCGTGTIGLTLAHRVGMVVGIEMNEAAIADAQINAEINGIKNCKFVCGKAEDVMKNLLEQYLGEDDLENDDESERVLPKDVIDSGVSTSSERRFTSVVVLVDPPRSGLHPTVIKLLRTHERIRRLVYVSCNPETLLANAVELCTPIGSADQSKGGFQRGPQRRTVVGHARQRIKSMPMSTPFSPIKAVAVDMFPHTPHCEVVMLMER